MNTFVRLLAPLALLAVLAGCADADPGDKPGDVGEPGSGSSPSTDASPSTTGSPDTGKPSPVPGKQAVSVTLRVEGGLRPTDETQVFASDEPPPPGHNAADVARALELASDPRLLDVAMTKVSKDACCDLQTYRVTVTYADDTSRTYLSRDGLQQPRPFEQLLSALA